MNSYLLELALKRLNFGISPKQNRTLVGWVRSPEGFHQLLVREPTLLSKANYFTTLDLQSGYWQVAMQEGSREQTAFVTHSGLYEFIIMPFGLCNTPATFQRLMETVLADLIRDKCIAYIRDILVVGKTFDEVMQNMERVLQRLKKAGLWLKPVKCHFLRESVEYLTL